MTDTAANKTNHRNPNNTMRSTHPAYTEYRLPNSQSGAQPISRAQGQNTYRNAGQNPNRQAQVRNFQAAQPRNLPTQNNQPRQLTADELRRRRDAERRRREAARREEEARRLAEETRKRAEAAAKAAARQAKKAQAKLYRELRKLNTIKTDSRYTFPMAIVATAAAFTLLVLAIVTTSVQISEITTENSALQRTYDSLVAEENKLRMELEVRDDLRTVENLAKNEYGMVKQDQVERYYLRTYNADKIELIEEEEIVEKTSWADRIAGVFNSIGERILSFFRK